MPGEPILIVDDTPVNLKLTRIVLAGEGYEVRAAADAEEALELLETFRPRLALVDIQLPGMDGLELTRRIKQNPELRGTLVVALTAFAMKGDEQKAVGAGCDGYITKPIDTRALPAMVQGYLSKAGTAAPPRPAPATPHPVLRDLEQRFMAEGVEESRSLQEALDGSFDADRSRRVLHQWVGVGGMLGHPEISQLARKLERLLQEHPDEISAELRDGLAELVRAFSGEGEPEPVPVPEPVLEMLAGKRFGLVGFDQADAARITAALERAHAAAHRIDAAAEPDRATLRAFDLLMLQVRPDSGPSPWLDARTVSGIEKPLVILGTRGMLLGIEPAGQAGTRDFLLDPWRPEEALVRAYLALFRASRAAEDRMGPGANGKPTIVIADDDPTVTSLVKATVQSYGMECRVASDGGQALELIRSTCPNAAVLDVNMPNLDGFEVLATLKNDRQTRRVRTILLTARQQESDIIRGFGLGADDYMLKPFSPMELVARLKRLVGRAA
jgi:CheY-like chemotaxis protein